MEYYNFISEYPNGDWVIKWLKKFNMNWAVKIFKKDQICAWMLMNLTLYDLNEMNVGTRIQKRKMLRTINKCKNIGWNNVFTYI